MNRCQIKENLRTGCIIDNKLNVGVMPPLDQARAYTEKRTEGHRSTNFKYR